MSCSPTPRSPCSPALMVFAVLVLLFARVPAYHDSPPSPDRRCGSVALDRDSLSFLVVIAPDADGHRRQEFHPAGGFSRSRRCAPASDRMTALCKRATNARPDRDDHGPTVAGMLPVADGIHGDVLVSAR